MKRRSPIASSGSSPPSASASAALRTLVRTAGLTTLSRVSTRAVWTSCWLYDATRVTPNLTESSTRAGGRSTPTTRAGRGALVALTSSRPNGCFRLARPGLTLFFLVMVAGGVWMLADALRRGASPLWVAVLVVLFPFSWPIYFLAVKLPAWSAGRHAAADAALPRTPWVFGFGSSDPELDLADALEASDRAAEAEALYRAVLARDATHLRARHGLARALLSLARPGEAVAALEQVLVADRAFRGYSAALDYAEALWQSGRGGDAVEVMERVAALTDRMNHWVGLAHYLALDGRPGAARQVLERAIAEHRSRVTPERGDARWIERATVMLQSLRG
jgi:hypothetical protein